MTHERAGLPAQDSDLVDVAKLITLYYAEQPDPENIDQRVAFGTSGHRGTSLKTSFNEFHILATTQAIVEYRTMQGTDGPLFIAKDTHGLSEPAWVSALEVLAANDVEIRIDSRDGYTPTPVISRAILAHNTARATGLADGIVITPSHNPPADGGFKYNPPTGGPADTDVTGWIQNRANALLAKRNAGVRRMSIEQARAAATTHEDDLVEPYVAALAEAINLEAIRSTGVRIGVDPLGGASLAYWPRIAERYGLDLTVVNSSLDPAFSFMTVDHDGKIRMDCSSPWAMAGLVGLKDRFAVAWGNDPDADRHGIVTPSAGLLNPNHYLAVAIHYLLTHRPSWSRSARIGKTLVSSALIDRVVADLGRALLEVPVGFKWFAPGLYDGSCCFGGEESAGASFLRLDGEVWTTDKDGLLLGLLAAEITAVTGRDPGVHYAELTARLGAPVYTRIDTPCTPAEKAGFTRLTPEAVTAATLAGDPIESKLTRAPGNGAPIGGLKVTTAQGWFAARPSGTENVYKLYAESFRDAGHLDRIVQEAHAMVSRVLG